MEHNHVYEVMTVKLHDINTGRPDPKASSELNVAFGGNGFLFCINRSLSQKDWYSGKTEAEDKLFCWSHGLNSYKIPEKFFVDLICVSLLKMKLRALLAIFVLRMMRIGSKSRFSRKK